MMLLVINYQIKNILIRTYKLINHHIFLFANLLTNENS